MKIEVVTLMSRRAILTFLLACIASLGTAAYGLGSPAPIINADANPLERVSEAEVDSVCSAESLAKTGSFADINRKQCRWAQAGLRIKASQKGDTCTCEALLNAAFDLGIAGTISDLAKNFTCNNGNFSLFDSDNLKDRKLAGRSYGSVFGDHKFTGSDEAIRQLVSAVSAGKIVVVSLNVHSIYSDYSKRHNVDNPASLHSSHALLIRAILKDQYGHPRYFVVIDSSGPHRRYVVPYKVLIDAYKSWSMILSRGIYISDAKRS